MKKAVIIDDDRIIRYMTRTILSEQGYHVIEAENGEEGLQKAKLQTPDVVLLDIMMPQLNGWEFIENYRTCVDSILIPIVFMTNPDSMDIRARIFCCPADDFMQKPFSASDLLTRTSKAIVYGKRIRKSLFQRTKQKNFTVTGNELGIASFFFFLEAQRKTGKLLIEDSHTSCNILFWQGSIVKAEIGGQNLNNDEVIHELFTWAINEYKFTEDNVVASDAIYPSVASLISKHNF